MATGKTVEAMAAIDHTGKWIIYGFEGLETVEGMQETGVTEELQEPTAYCKVRVTLFLPEALEVPVMAGAAMAIGKD